MASNYKVLERFAGLKSFSIFLLQTTNAKNLVTEKNFYP
jgi:hypothetical protein